MAIFEDIPSNELTGRSKSNVWNSSKCRRANQNRSTEHRRRLPGRQAAAVSTIGVTQVDIA